VGVHATPAGSGLTLRAISVTAKNYVGQLRLYSYADLVLLLLAVGATSHELAQASLLWFGFLVLLEYIHRDRGRARWPAWTWIALLAAALAIRPSPILVPFVAFAAIYTMKKALPPLALIAPLINGCLKGSLVCLVPSVAAWQVIIVIVLTSLRNLTGDLRDIEKDRAEGVRTLPVRAGLQKDVRWVYPVALASTSTLWTVLGNLPVWALAGALAIQATTYRWTPR
jgi:1,4-dihydroxy-2-naphthoate octaprenyltransferase